MSDKFELRFDQDTVNMINKIFQERNWFVANGPSFVAVPNVYGQAERVLSITPVILTDFVFDSKIFWQEFNYNTMSPVDNQLHQDLIVDLCGYLIDNAPTPTCDIYMHSLSGFLEYDSPGTHKVMWKYKGLYD